VFLRIAEVDDQTLLKVQDLSLGFGGIQALVDIRLEVRSGELFSVIGPNGAGKTSLLNCISGRYIAASGRLLFDGRDITRLAPHRRASVGIGRTFQNLALQSHDGPREHPVTTTDGAVHRCRLDDSAFVPTDIESLRLPCLPSTTKEEGR